MKGKNIIYSSIAALLTVSLVSCAGKNVKQTQSNLRFADIKNQFQKINGEDYSLVSPNINRISNLDSMLYSFIVKNNLEDAAPALTHMRANLKSTQYEISCFPEIKVMHNFPEAIKQAEIAKKQKEKRLSINPNNEKIQSEILEIDRDIFLYKATQDFIRCETDLACKTNYTFEDLIKEESQKASVTIEKDDGIIRGYNPYYYADQMKGIKRSVKLVRAKKGMDKAGTYIDTILVANRIAKESPNAYTMPEALLLETIAIERLKNKMKSDPEGAMKRIYRSNFIAYASKVAEGDSNMEGEVPNILRQKQLLKRMDNILELQYVKKISTEIRKKVPNFEDYIVDYESKVNALERIYVTIQPHIGQERAKDITEKIYAEIMNPTTVLEENKDRYEGIMKHATDAMLKILTEKQARNLHLIDFKFGGSPVYEKAMGYLKFIEN